MTCTSSEGFYQWPDQSPISFTQWKTILSKLLFNEDSKCLSFINFYNSIDSFFFFLIDSRHQLILIVEQQKNLNDNY